MRITHGRSQSQQIQTSHNKLSPSGEIMLRRYSDLRAEMRHRFDVRYKLIQMTFAILAGVVTAVLALKLFEIAFVGCIIAFSSALLLYIEILTINEIGMYLIKIGSWLDSKYEVPVDGWEITIRKGSEAQRRIRRFQVWNFILFFTVSYSSFNILGCTAIEGNLRYVVGGVCELPVILAIVVAFATQKPFLKNENPSR